MIPCAYGKLNVKHHRTTSKPEIHTSITVKEDEAALAENRASKRTQATQQQQCASIYIRVYTSEADFHKPGMYGGSMQVWANAWDVFRRTPPRGGRGRRAAVDLFRGVFF